MFLFIPGELIALLTFPGVILHEIAHRFACDILEIPVYGICYFTPSKDISGYVSHQKITRASHSFLVGIAPLIINTIVSMFLLLPFGLANKLNTNFIINDGIDFFIIWMGTSIAYNAVPSNKDMEEVPNLASGDVSLSFFMIIQGFVALYNIPILGFFLRITHGYVVSYLFASLFL